ncbi:hypothetical protein [Nocardioides sp. GY 10127]|uniref:hypothetical protein n=1 Tax=Nocardioides sp. GY 10127 TaxID=2569762 RepID=UPI0010A91D6F|nr:hypothetical protein [Nocardioides sp. GY 10127]TIC84377.1 hypothetical protein E8D37_06310 [Nocardioides sp. GY 10127]
MSYDVVLLIEQALSSADADRVRGLHQGLLDDGEQVVYHVVLPVEDAGAQVQAAMGSLSGDLGAGRPADLLSPEEVREIDAAAHERAGGDLRASLESLAEAGATAEGALTDAEPVTALVAKVSEVDAAEVIVLTAPHVVSEFFHVDWTSRARRHLGVPVLHLLEHENFDEQAGEGEGVSGF